MKLSRRHLIGASVVAAVGLGSPRLFATPYRPKLPTTPTPPVPSTPPGIVEQALAALDTHSARILDRDMIGVADYSLNSGEDRFHLVDIVGGRIVRSYLVSHGRGSDRSNSGYVQKFSNRPGSYASSQGSFVTGETYYGKHGKSRRLIGLEEQNSLALDRAIVIHGADYVDRSMAKQQGRVGRSLGCFAFERCEIGEVLEILGPGRLLYSGKLA